MTEADLRLRFIEQVEYRGYRIKVARRGDEIRILVYPPGAVLATRIVIDAVANHVRAFESAKALVDRLCAEAELISFDDLVEPDDEDDLFGEN